MKKILFTFLCLSLFCLLPLLAAQAGNTTCDCTYQRCVNISETENADGEINSPDITLTGISAIRKSEHPTQGEFSSIVLMLDKAACFHGSLFTSGDNPQPTPYMLPNTTYIQLILSGDENIESFSKDNKGKHFTVTGKPTYGISAWHITPILLNVDSFKAID